MPRLAIPLTEKQIAEFEPKRIPYKLGDGRGLYLLVEPAGQKRWRMRFSRFGKESNLAFGTYPALSLSEARNECRIAHQLIADGIDPVELKREQARLKREQASQNRPVKKIPNFRLSMSSDGDMIIETASKQMILSPVKVATLRAFLIATDGGNDGE